MKFPVPLMKIDPDVGKSWWEKEPFSMAHVPNIGMYTGQQVALLMDLGWNVSNIYSELDFQTVKNGTLRFSIIGYPGDGTITEKYNWINMDWGACSTRLNNLPEKCKLDKNGFMCMSQEM